MSVKLFSAYFQIIFFISMKAHNFLVSEYCVLQRDLQYAAYALFTPQNYAITKPTAYLVTTGHRNWKNWKNVNTHAVAEISKWRW